MKIIGANITGSFILNGQDITTTIQSSSIWSGSMASSITSINSTTSSLNSATASLYNYTSSNTMNIVALIAASASLNANVTDIKTTTSSLNIFTGSASSRLSSIETTTGSLNNTVSSSVVRISALEAKTGSYSTTGSNTFVGNQTISGSLIPAVNITYDLGSSTNKWKDLYLSGSTIYLGDVILSATTGGFEITNSSGSYQNIIGSASYATNAVTASSADNLTVRGTLTAQTLVVQTITSSVDYVTGSTRFGSLLINTHAFTGSVGITGSLSSTSLTGSIAYSNLTGVPTLVSGSSQISYTGLSNIPTGIVSGSSQITYSSISSIPAGIVSGSAQVTGIGNSQLTNSTISGISLGSNLATLTIGTGLSGTSYNGSTGVTIANTGVTSITAGTGISINQGTGGVTITNTISNTNQLTNGAGFITGVTWPNVGAGFRENYNLQFRPADNSSSYAGFSFASPGNDANAGYLLVRGGADNDVYTQNGLTIVADLGWLTLAQRTTSGKGVRIMTGTSSTTRMDISTAGLLSVYGTSYAATQTSFSPSLHIRGGYYGGPRLQVYGLDADSSGWMGLGTDMAAGAYQFSLYYPDVSNSSISFGRFNGGNGTRYSGYTTTALLSYAGTFTAAGDIVAYGSPSDVSLKTNIKPLENSLDKIIKLQGVSFTWKENTDASKLTEIKDDLGFIAQEVEKVLPELVRKNKDNGLLSLRDKGIMPLLVEAIKEQQSQIEELKSIINGLTK